MNTDPYIITDESVKEPPVTFLQRLKFLGPGFILSASIVGSGELIATTVLGAKAGFVALWIIIVSCLVKVTVQLEFGKHAVLTGQTTMHAFDLLPGPRLGRGRWTVWTVFILTIPKVVQIGGIMGGCAIVLNLLYPAIPIVGWTLFNALLIAVLIYNGKYNWVEKLSLGMIAMFTVLTMASLYFLKYTPFDISWADISSGLRFKLPGEVVAIAIGAFGITGVASDEIIAYNYWCIEKGYAAFAGKSTDTQGWRDRAQGWINVMFLDAIVAMLIYTAVTVTFYLLGAAVLHNRSEVPMGNAVIETLALIYTESLGPGVKMIYLIGAFFVLFSSLYATLAAWTRLLSDVFGQLGWIDFSNLKARRHSIAVLAWVLPFIWASAFLFIALPVLMVLSGGIIGSILLFLVVFAAYQFKYRQKQWLRASWFYDIAFWLSLISILSVAVYGLVQVF